MHVSDLRKFGNEIGLLKENDIGSIVGNHKKKSGIKYFCNSVSIYKLYLFIHIYKPAEVLYEHGTGEWRRGKPSSVKDRWEEDEQ